MNAWRRVLTIGFVVLAVSACLAAAEDDVDWTARLGEKLNELRQGGESVTWEEFEASRPDIPDSENSALIWLEAFEHLREVYSDIPSRSSARVGKRHSDELLAMLRDYVEGNRKALELAHGAAHQERGMYPIAQAAEPFAAEMPHLSLVRVAARLLVGEAVFHAHAGLTAEAAASLVACRRLAGSLADPQSLTSMLVRMATDGILSRGVERTLAICELAPEDLRGLREELLGEAAELSLRRAWQAERIETHRLFGQAAEHMPQEAAGELASQVPEEHVRAGRRAFNQILARDELYCLSVIDRALKLEALPERERLREARRLAERLDEELKEGTDTAECLRRIALAPVMERLGDAATADEVVENLVNALLPDAWPPLGVSAMIMPAVERASVELLKAAVWLRVAAAALAVEEYRLRNGRWPGTLGELVPEFLDVVPDDPFSDASLRYRRGETGVSLYSLGPDGIDNAGLDRDEVAGALDEGRGAEGWDRGQEDLGFRLLDAGLRGAETLSFRDDLLGSYLSMEDLRKAGYTVEKLKGYGFTEEEIERVVRRVE